VQNTVTAVLDGKDTNAPLLLLEKQVSRVKLVAEVRVPNPTSQLPGVVVSMQYQTTVPVANADANVR
jgi:hypothetical protein